MFIIVIQLSAARPLLVSKYTEAAILCPKSQTRENNGIIYTRSFYLIGLRVRKHSSCCVIFINPQTMENFGKIVLNRE